MKVGIDFGSSLIKAAWMNDKGLQFASTADLTLEQMVGLLRADNIQVVNRAGIGYSDSHTPHFEGFTVNVRAGDHIENEIVLQAEGVKRLMRDQGYAGENFLLVSMGTGTSYTLVTKDKIVRFPLGNSISGGFMNGLGQLLGADDYRSFATRSSEGMALDICVKDMIPEKAGTFEGELIVANFGKAKGGSKESDAYASIVSTAAVATIRDVMILGMIPSFESSEDVVFIGSPVTRTPLLRDLLQNYSLAIGKKPHFPKKGEFALAVGAYLSE